MEKRPEGARFAQPLTQVTSNRGEEEENVYFLLHTLAQYKCILLPGFFWGGGDQTQGLGPARQVPYAELNPQPPGFF